MTYQEFKNQVMGRGYDVDGYYGNQCWDGYAYYCKWLGYPYANCTTSGYVKDIWNNRKSNGILNYFSEVSTMQSGDVTVFKVSSATPYSHIAIFDSDIDGTYGYFLGQNQGATNGVFSLCKLPYSATFDTAFRPKAFENKTQTTSNTFDKSKLTEEHAKATFTVDKVNARVNSPSGDVCRQYNSGDTVEYTHKYVGNGHRYICWYEASNLIMVAISESEDYNSTKWATFSAIEETPSQSTTTNTELTDEHGWAKYKVDQVNVRKDSVNGDTVKQVNSGDVVEYTQKYVGNGHRYISYVEGSTRYYVVCSPTEERSTEYCDFYSENPTTEEKKEEAKKEDTKTDYTKNIKGYGIDLSEHNADVDVSKYDFVIIRCAWGENTDKLFESYVSKCEQSNVPYGVYLYDYALNDEQAQAEADYCLNLIKDKNIQMGVWFDMEDADGYKKKMGILNQERCTSSCEIFCKALKAKGYYVGIYCSSSWIGNYVTCTDYPLWIANWGTNDGTVQSDQSSKAVMHQYTSNPLDLDVIYHDVSYFKSNPIEEDKKEDTEDKKDDVPSADDTDTKTDTSTKIDTDKVNTLISLLIKLIKNLLKLFKK